MSSISGHFHTNTCNPLGLLWNIFAPRNVHHIMNGDANCSTHVHVNISRTEEFILHLT